MTEENEQSLLKKVHAGDETVFERVYDVFSQRVRLVAWKISHRQDWIDDLVSEAWIRAFRQRASYDAARPFLVWMAGILRNVYREQCRKSPTTWDQDPDEAATERVDSATPESIAEEAELLAALNDCVGRLSPEDGDIVRMRFFEGAALRAISQKMGIAEATLREYRLPNLLESLRKCLSLKEISMSVIFKLIQVDKKHVGPD